jgi:hypothetical protein
MNNGKKLNPDQRHTIRFDNGIDGGFVYEVHDLQKDGHCKVVAVSDYAPIKEQHVRLGYEDHSAGGSGWVYHIGNEMLQGYLDESSDERGFVV